ncbi:hypothetical protein CRUP_020565, partial [Coryphaenoides rupestris]
IEILTYCQLTCRQRLLYKALRNKISIEDLLQSSMGTAQQAHSTTSSLMNLVMQFRKVCNHPDLFERQETRSPFHMALKPYIMSKFLYRQGLVHAHDQAKKKLLQALLSPFCPNHIQQSLFHREETSTKRRKEKQLPPSFSEGDRNNNISITTNNDNVTTENKVATVITKV